MKAELVTTRPDRHRFAHLYKDRRRMNYSQSRLGEHHLFELLDWNPQAIKNTASLLNSMTLPNLYFLIVECNNDVNKDAV